MELHGKQGESETCNKTRKRIERLKIINADVDADRVPVVTSDSPCDPTNVKRKHSQQLSTN